MISLKYSTTDWIYFQQEHWTTVFCILSARRSKYCLQISTARERLELNSDEFHSFSIFEVYLLSSIRFWEAWCCTFDSPTSAIIRKLKRNPKITGFENVTEWAVEGAKLSGKVQVICNDFPNLYSSSTFKRCLGLVSASQANSFPGRAVCA